ncbi:MAG TPA: hypothetical protein PK129_10950 [Cellvibrionaceae bacterium]|nr:hypothetical protein [Cellvibrionaceae bacterium]
MADPVPANGANDSPGKTQKITITCNELWSFSQQFSYIRLSDKVDENHYKLIGLYAARARRIAATYARFYLETEEGGDKAKIGRYYWMALGAFASKTVACLLDTLQLNASYALGKLTFETVDGHNVANGLGQGNLWLFSDIAPAHWFYSHYPENFFNGMACLNKRDCDTYIEPVKSVVKGLPWADKSISKIKRFSPSNDLIKGFNFITQIEASGPGIARRKLQYEHLLAIANHEQGAILQKLIYDDPDFNKWTNFERKWWVHWAMPTYQLVFSHQCSIGDEQLKSVAPDNLIVENFQSRMMWIVKAADQFHALMDKRSTYMHSELSTISSWVNSPDAWLVY